MNIRWVLVHGGLCRFGDRGRPKSVQDLLWTMTPLTLRQVGSSEDPSREGLPLTQINHLEASRLAAALGARLPTSLEWEWMAGGSDQRAYPWGNDVWSPLKGNLRPSRIGCPARTGSFPEGATPEGLLDVAGNVWEWTASIVCGNGAVIRGGSYNSLPLYARTRFLNMAPQELRSPGIGVRLVRLP